jgi:tRNA (guanine26-N2/guanine27-N2)-dimethyltransferase
LENKLVMSGEIWKPDFPTETVMEGNVKLVVPKLKSFVKSRSEYAPSKAPVFYNPVMEFNRDLAVLALQAYQRTINHEITVCELLAGCGAMGIRFAAEVKGVKKVVMTDINERASKLARQNIELNNLVGRVTVEHEEANLLLSMHGAPHERFDVIDIDPFGSPVRYLDSAIRALRNHGLLAVTATDMAPLCGVHSKACIRKYGGKPLRTEYCHELAVRLLAGCLASTAARHDMGVEVVFSHSSDHYVRVYATIKYGAKKADDSIRNLGFMMHCFNCLHREASRENLTDGCGKCSECGSRLNYAGPLWLGRISDAPFCVLMEGESQHRLLKLGERIEGLLVSVEKESETLISYYVIDELCHILGLPVPSVKRVAEALKKEGFSAFLTHFDSRGIRSNAPAMMMGSILRGIAKEKREVLNNLGSKHVLHR